MERVEHVYAVERQMEDSGNWMNFLDGGSLSYAYETEREALRECMRWQSLYPSEKFRVRRYTRG